MAVRKGLQVGAIVTSIFVLPVIVLHFILAKAQYDHDGDNMFFVPVSLIIVAPLSFAAARNLVMRKSILLSVGIAFVVIFAAGYGIIKWPFPISILLVSPIFFSLIVGGLTGRFDVNSGSQISSALEGHE